MKEPGLGESSTIPLSCHPDDCKEEGSPTPRNASTGEIPRRLRLLGMTQKMRLANPQPYPANLRKATDVLCPPKPKAFESATSTGRSCGALKV